MNKRNTIGMWLILILLLVLLSILNYIKFFGIDNENIIEKPVENSTSEAINKALNQIVENFNQNQLIEEYRQQEKINIKAIRNNYSIFVSYSTETETTTYEFYYGKLHLTIDVEKEEENLKKFKTIYKILIESCQKRIENEEDISEKIDQILNLETSWNGLFQEEKDNIITYQIDITKKIEL